ncbi:MAG: hypothetical protein D6675_08445 [Gemmatimonadetes bacterium]|nr:MAG: hypothetical protein D6675_08445 [Gemmatimonadota bacterium]
MIRHSLILSFVFTFGMVCFAYSQSLGLNPSATPLSPNLVGDMATKGISLIDPAKLDIDQSVTVSYATNGQNSLMSNLYLNTMSYQFNPKLNLKLHFGLAYQPAAVSSILETDQRFILPGAELTYKPTENLMIHLNISTGQGGYLAHDAGGFPSSILSKDRW